MTDRQKAIATIDFLNKKAGRKFKHTETNTTPIVARLKDGFTAKDIAKVIVYKVNDWNNNPQMSKYLRPETLFRPSKFESYLNEIEAEKSVNGTSSDHSSLINQEYEETEDPEAQKKWQESRNRLEEVRKTYPKKVEENKQQQMADFDNEAPFHLGTGKQRKDWNSYNDFVQETLVRWDTYYSEQEAKKEAIMNSLPESVRKKMKERAKQTDGNGSTTPNATTTF